MKEFLPFLLGVAAGYPLGSIDRRRLRAAVTLGVALVGGACASAVNGELAGSLWPLFVSVDAVLVYLGVATSAAIRAAGVRRGVVSFVRRTPR
jgi:hypothetical protein